MKKPKLANIEELLSKNNRIVLTDAQYERKTGAALPKERSYLLNKSALAKICKRYGFRIELQEKTVTLIKEDQ